MFLCSYHYKLYGFTTEENENANSALIRLLPNSVLYCSISQVFSARYPFSMSGLGLLDFHFTVSASIDKLFKLCVSIY